MQIIIGLGEWIFFMTKLFESGPKLIKSVMSTGWGHGSSIDTSIGNPLKFPSSSNWCETPSKKRKLILMNFSNPKVESLSI